MNSRILYRPDDTGHGRHESRTFGGEDAVDFYLEDAMIHPTAKSVAEQIHSLAAEASMALRMAAPLSGIRSGYGPNKAWPADHRLSR